MPKTKDSIIRVRVSKELEESFKEMCEYDGKNSSNVMRNLIKSYISRHPVTTQNIDVDFIIEPYPETNPHAYYCYNITATLKGDLSKVSENEIIFMLPEFITKEKEPYRVDSFHHHRKPYPGCYGKDNRVLSVNFIDGIWKGGIFIYDDNILNNPKTLCFEEIKKELKDIDTLRKLVLKWDKEKDAMILLRSNAAKMLVTTKTTIPTFIGGTNHPIALGTVKSFMAPEGNITGVTYYIEKKTTFRMMKLFIPNLKSILFIGEQGHPSTEIEQAETKHLAQQFYKINYHEIISSNIEFILKEIKKEKNKVSAIVLGNQALIMDNAKEITEVADNVPVFSYSKVSVSHGALAGYSANDNKMGIMLAQSVYAVIIENKKISSVPIKIDRTPLFYVNEKTLEKLDIQIPERLREKVIFVEEINH